MGMVVQHNLTAMNSNRMLGVTSSAQAKSTEKLSSGYKINRAADDAAGLSISEKMRKQIRGLTQASANAQDGISAVQTAEGALTEVHDMLQRMNELAVKASNGTNSESDRDAIQAEIDQLVTEIDRVSTTTKFNETYLLKGDVSGKTSAAQTVSIRGVDATMAAGVTAEAGDVTLGTVTVERTGTLTGATVDADALAKSNGDVVNALNAVANTSGAVTLTYSQADADTPGSWTINDGNGATAISAAEIEKAGINTGSLSNTNNGQTIILTKALVANPNLSESKVTYDADSVTAANLATAKVGSDVKATIKVDEDGVATLNAYDATYVPNKLSLDLHVGADSTSDNKIGLEIAAMSAKGLGLRNTDGSAIKVDGKDSTNADAAINTIAAAIQKVSEQRSALGAVQNRLEHTINNLDNVVENTTSAESAIRDTDMASEMVKYSNNNILAQAGTSMLAQANQSNQNILSLLG